MSWITENPSSGILVQCLAKIIVMVLSCPLKWTWSVLWQHIATRCVCVCVCVCVQFTVYEGTVFLYSELHTHTTGQNMLP